MILVLVVVGFLGLCMADLADAADTADITVTVTCRVLGVTVSPATWALGLVEVNSEAVKSAAIVVTNSGNASETYQLKLTDPLVWAAVQTDATLAAEKYQLGAIFQTTATAAPVAVDYVDSADFVSTTYVTCTAAIFAKTIGSGVNVPASGLLDLWLYFRAPPSTAETAQKSIVVTVKAIAGV
jgi:hypothetical protein